MRAAEVAVAAVAVRQGGMRDLPEAERIVRAANEQYRQMQDAAAFDPYLAMVLDIAPRLSHAQLLMAAIDGAAVGTVTFFPDARDEGWGMPAGTAGLRSMAVDPQARGRGVGRALLDDCVRRARRSGARALVLHTADWLPAAIQLYARAGFVRDPAHDVRASVAVGVPPHLDYTGLAYRLDLT